MGFKPGKRSRQILRLLHQLWHSCFLRRLIGCLLVFVLTGCTSPAQRQEQGVIHLSFWQGVNPPPNRVVLESLIDQFNQSHPQIQVDSFYIGQPDQQMPKILAAVVGNAPPDLLWYNPTITGQLVELGALRPLEEWWQASPVRSQIDPALLSTMNYQQHTWSVPFGTNNIGIFYRPSLFKAAGVTTLPKTWAELRQTAKQLTRDTNGDGKVDQRGIFLSLGQGEFAVFTWLPFMWSAGSELSTQALRAVDLVNPGAIAALQFWSDLLKDGSAMLSLPERGYELDNFLAGKVAMQITGPWTLAQLQQSGVDFGVLPIPEQVKSATGLGGENLFVFKTTPEREQAALMFAEYVVSQGFQTDWALKTGYLPVNLRSRQSEAYQQFVAQQPTLEVFLQQMAVAQARPLFAGYNRVSENLGRALESVLLQKSSPEVALQQSQARLDLIAEHQN
ncbi:MAG: ABC transporter substrate-binding protein [Aphanocapsa sp. GSE-SYN-MK-11-07L]|jgi:multiple sugar transport system substrate-binding protein|nr:ABC transporter substrate-binding protein [Aphanocapsa sp. GSE-SYN-MK-11-07L]